MAFKTQMTRRQNLGWWFDRWWLGRREFWRNRPFTARSLALTLIALATLMAALGAENLRGHFSLSGLYADNEPALSVFAQNRTLVEGANRLFITLELRHGSVWQREMLVRLRRLHERVASLDGIDTKNVRSLWRSDLIAIHATEDGMRSTTIFSQPDQKPLTVQNIAIAAHRAGAIGRYVSSDERAALITAPLKAQGLDAEEHIDYRQLAREIELVQHEFSDDLSQVKVSGPPLWAARALSQSGQPRLWLLAGICLVILLLTAAFGSILIGAMVSLSVACALLWTLGIWSVAIGPLSPYASLVLGPVIAFGLLMASLYGAAVAREISKGSYAPFATALSGLRRVFLLSTLASAGVGASLMLTPLGITREAGLLAALGMTAQGLSVGFFMPLLARFLIRDDEFVSRLRFRRLERHNMFAPLLRLCRSVPALLLACLCVAVIALKFVLPQPRADIWPIAPRTTTASSKAAQAYASLAERFPAGLSTLSFVASAPLKSCLNPGVVSYLDVISKELGQTPGVVRMRALPDLVRHAHAANHGGNPKWQILPRHPLAILQAMAPLPSDMPLSMRDCSVFALHADLDVRHDPSQLLERAEHVFKRGVPQDIPIVLSPPSGDAALTAAAQRALEDAQLPAILRALSILVIAASFAFLNGRHALIALLPSLTILFLGTALAPLIQEGRDVTTLALVIIWAGVAGGVGIAMQRSTVYALQQGEEESEAGFDALRRRGSTLLAGTTCAIVVLAFAVLAAFPLETTAGLVGVTFALIILLMTLIAQPAANSAWARFSSRWESATRK